MKILFVLTSHDQLGDTGKKTGFWVEEFAGRRVRKRRDRILIDQEKYILEEIMYQNRLIKY